MDGIDGITFLKLAVWFVFLWIVVCLIFDKSD